MPDRIKRYLPALPWLKSNGLDFLNAHCVGEFFGGSHFRELPKEADPLHRPVYERRDKNLSRIRTDLPRGRLK